MNGLLHDDGDMVMIMMMIIGLWTFGRLDFLTFGLWASRPWTFDCWTFGFLMSNLYTLVTNDQRLKINKNKSRVGSSAQTCGSYSHPLALRAWPSESLELRAPTIYYRLSHLRVERSCESNVAIAWYQITDVGTI